MYSVSQVLTGQVNSPDLRLKNCHHLTQLLLLPKNDGAHVVECYKAAACSSSSLGPICVAADGAKLEVYAKLLSYWIRVHAFGKMLRDAASYRASPKTKNKKKLYMVLIYGYW